MFPILVVVFALAAEPSKTVDFDPDQSTYFRGVFEHRGKTMSIQIGHDRFAARDGVIEGAEVHVEQGCFRYSASGYRKGDTVVLLPVRGDVGVDYSKEEFKEIRVLVANDAPFDIASLICRLDDQQRITRADVVLPDLTIYRIKRDHKTPHDP